MRLVSSLLLASLAAAGEVHPTVHVGSERPWYRPGETACLRAILLDAVSRAPVATSLPVCLRIRDGRGQVVWSGLADPADGVAAAGWPVPALGGSYTVEAVLGTRAASEPRRILVAQASAVPGAVEAELQFDRRGYAPGDTAGIALVLRNRSGQPLADCPAVLRVALSDGSVREERVCSDAQGRAAISLGIPATLDRRSGTVTASLPGDDGGLVASRSIPIASARLELRAEVEGGQLIAGREAVVFVQARSEDGQPADCRGSLLDAGGRSVADLATRHEGRARLVFTPSPGATYRIVLGAPVVQELALPAVQPAGATLSGASIQPGDQPLRLRLDAPAGRYAVRVQRRGVLVAERQVVLAQAQVQDLALDPACAGVMDVAVLCDSGGILAQRTVFRRPTRSIALAVDAPAIADPQQPVTVNLRLRGPDGKALSGLASLAVVEAGDDDLVEARERPPRLPALAWLDGEVEELADSGSYLADDGASAERLDLLLGVQSWRHARGTDADSRLRRLRAGDTPILPRMLAPAIDIVPAALAVSDSEMGGSGVFLAIGAGGGAGGLFGQRTGGQRIRMLGRHGGTKRSESSVWGEGRWMRRAQSPDGRWSAVHWPKATPFDDEPEGLGTWTGPSADRCTTALALLTYLGAGYDHKTPNRYKASVKRGLDWLQGQIAVSGAVDADPVVQACVAMALAEAYAMTSDPELRRPAQAAIDRLLQVQHRAGGWAASGRADDARLDGPASAWCVMALKSALAGGLSVADGMVRAKAYFDAAWSSANPDSGRVSTFPGTYDAATRTAHAPACVAAGAVMAVFLGHRAGDPVLESLADALAENPPRSVPMDPMVLYWGNLAMFQVGGERWQMWNAVVRDFLVSQQRWGDQYEGSWDPDLFGASGAAWGRVITSAFCTLSLEVYYRYSQVVSSDAGPAPVRAELRSSQSPGRPDEAVPPGTLAWWAAVPVGSDGCVSLQIPAAGRGRRLTLRADAMDASGGFTVAAGDLEFRAPVEVSVRLPAVLQAGDRWDVPCAVRGAEPRVEAAGGSCTAALVDGRLLLSAVSAGPAQVRVTARSEAGSDARSREVAILPAGAPWRDGRQLQGAGRIEMPQQAFLPGGLHGAIVVERGFDALLEAVHAWFDREPHGCFEQTSSTSHPLALTCQRRIAAGLPADPAAIGHLAAAVVRLQGFACPGGGFSLFGRDPGDPVLTAYGLRQFRLLGRLTPVDQDLIAREQAWLLDRRDASGGFGLGAAATDGQLCLVQIAADLGDGCPAEDRQRAYAAAEQLGTAYALGLAARLARDCREPVVADRLMAQVQRLPDGGVARPGASPWRPQAEIEAVALAVLDSLAQQRDDEARRSLAWLSLRRCGASWDITQANVLAIEAFAAAERLLPAGQAASLSVSQGGRTLGGLELVAGSRGAQVLPLAIDPAAGPLQVAVSGELQVWRWQLEGRLERPLDAPDAPLALTLALPPRLAVGQPCELLARVQARSATYAPLLRIGIPAGLEPRSEALDRLVRSRRIASWESVDGEVRIYGETLAAGAAWDVPIACVAVAAGSFRGAASSALPYYEPQRVAWQPGVSLTIDR